MSDSLLATGIFMINNMHRFSVPKKTAFHLGFVIMLVKWKLKGSACIQHNDWFNIWNSAKWSLIYCDKNVENFCSRKYHCYGSEDKQLRQTQQKSVSLSLLIFLNNTKTLPSFYFFCSSSFHQTLCFQFSSVQLLFKSNSKVIPQR